MEFIIINVEHFYFHMIDILSAKRTEMRLSREGF